MTRFESVAFLRDAFEKALSLAEELGASEETLAGMRTMYKGQDMYMARIEAGEYDAATEAKVLTAVKDACISMHEIAIEDSLLVKLSDYFYEMLTRLRQWTLDAVKDAATGDIKDADLTPPPMVDPDLRTYEPPGGDGDHQSPPSDDVDAQAGVVPVIIREGWLLAVAVVSAAYLFWFRNKGFGARGTRNYRRRR